MNNSNNSNNNNNRKRSFCFGSKQYTPEEICKILDKTMDQQDLLIYYVDQIRNYNELTDDMLKIIENFDNDSKMILIKEYNKIISTIKDVVS